MDMAAFPNLMSKLESETRVVQQRLLAYVQEQLLTKTQVLTAEMVGREEGWGRERDMLYGRIAKLEAENARFKGAGGLKRGKCCQCVKHKKTIASLKRDLRQCQEDSQDQTARLEEQVFMKRAKLRGYVQLLYAKDNEIARLELKCQQREVEVSDLEDKYLSSIEADLYERRVTLEKNIAEHSRSVSECLAAGRLTGDQGLSTNACSEQELSKDSRGGNEQSEDAEFLRSMEAELGRLIDQLWQDPSESVETASGDLLGNESDNVDPADLVGYASQQPNNESDNVDPVDLVDYASQQLKV